MGVLRRRMPLGSAPGAWRAGGACPLAPSHLGHKIYHTAAQGKNVKEHRVIGPPSGGGNRDSRREGRARRRCDAPTGSGGR